MTKRALLIGSQTGTLTGVHNDVHAVAERLTAWGFTTQLCIGQDATRQGILKGYLELIEKTQAEDAVVVYYSGHGGRVLNPDFESMANAGVPAPHYYQFIVPVDIDESTSGDFRGITSLELSALLARLTQKTRNATVVLDCCHAARMSRDLDLVPKSWDRPCFTDITAHLKELAAQGISLEAVDVESNPHAVRLVAAAPDESAYECTNPVGKRGGLLTDAWLTTLNEAEGLKVSWRSLGNRVRERVLSVVPYQRPEIEGPADRVLFELETVDLTGVLPVIQRGDEFVLQGGRLLGVNVGDVFAIMPKGADKPVPENRIARATVKSVTGGISKIEIKYSNGYIVIPYGANAFPVSTALPRRPVKLSASGEEAKKLAEAIDHSQLVRVTVDEDLAELLAEVVVAGGQIELCDRSALPLIEPKPYNEENVWITASNLDQFARVQTLLNLRSGEGTNALTTPYQVEWGRVVDGKPQPLAHAGDLVYVGEPVYVRVTNTGKEKLYFTLFDIGLAGKVTLLTASQPSGVGLEPVEDYTFGHKEGVGLTGVKLFWDDGVPRDAPRRESLLVICSDRPQDLRALEAKGMRDFKGTRGSPLQELIEQVTWGGTRGLGAEEQPDPDVRYAVSRVDFQVDPNPAPAQDQGSFLIDDRPERAFRAMIPEAKGKLPSTVDVRFTDLIVHSNRALFSTDIRLDVLVVTAPTGANASQVYEIKTATFHRIKDGDRLPFDNLLVYHGPVAHFLDMAVWVSRDQKDSLDLAELFKTEFNSNEFKSAASLLVGLAVAAPQAALVVGALGASATLINIGTKLLLQAVGKSVGLYRTSHLAFERFGAGRHPANGLLRAQDFSFGYEIIAVK